MYYHSALHHIPVNWIFCDVSCNNSSMEFGIPTIVYPVNRYLTNAARQKYSTKSTILVYINPCHRDITMFYNIASTLYIVNPTYHAPKSLI